MAINFIAVNIKGEPYHLLVEEAGKDTSGIIISARDGYVAGKVTGIKIESDEHEEQLQSGGMLLRSVIGKVPLIGEWSHPATEAKDYLASADSGISEQLKGALSLYDSMRLQRAMSSPSSGAGRG